MQAIEVNCDTDIDVYTAAVGKLGWDSCPRALTASKIQAQMIEPFQQVHRLATEVLASCVQMYACQ
jgi:hypothetical protein